MFLRYIFIFSFYLFASNNADAQDINIEEGLIKWDANGKVTASIENQPLEKILQLLSDQEKWQILVEPGLKLNVTTRFKDLTQTEALRRLLNDVNFVIIPSKRNQSKMLVYQTSSDNAVRKITPKIRNTKSSFTKKKR
jgi:hypothetical protein